MQTFTIRILALSLACLFETSTADAQFLPKEVAPPAEAVETVEKTADPLGRETPAGMITGFLAAVKEENFERAAEYLDLRGDPSVWGPGLARQFQDVLDRSGHVHTRLRLSSDPAGHQNDGLMPNEESFGLVRTDTGKVDLLAERIDREGAKIWLVSSKTVTAMPRLSRVAKVSLLDKVLPEALKKTRLGGAPVGHWLAVVALLIIAYAVTWITTKALWFVVYRPKRHPNGSRWATGVKASALPIRVLLATWLAYVASILTGVSIVARQNMAQVTEIVGWISLAWILWRVVDALADYSVESASRHGRPSMRTAITFIRRSLKAIIIATALMAILGAIGFNVTAGLAALGIGGIAIALGAQKTVEHIVGSLTIVADQPIRVGDFCRFGETLGTVEDIGMRSTKIRTLDRSIVTVPNGHLAALQIENLSRRDKFWFHPILELRYETTPEQMRFILAGLRSLLAEHPNVNAEPQRVRLIGLGQNALKIEVFSYVDARDFEHFLELQEDLTLRIMDLVFHVGASFAFASQTVYLAKDNNARHATRRAADVEAFNRANTG